MRALRHSRHPRTAAPPQHKSRAAARRRRISPTGSSRGADTAGIGFIKPTEPYCDSDRRTPQGGVADATPHPRAPVAFGPHSVRTRHQTMNRMIFVLSPSDVPGFIVSRTSATSETSAPAEGTGSCASVRAGQLDPEIGGVGRVSG